LLRAPSAVYNHALVDSRRWLQYTPRDSDVLICTSYKSGTTWMQQILAQLVFGGDPPEAATTIAPWLEQRHTPIEVVLAKLGAQTHQRFIKSHLPLQALPFYAQVRHVVVARDGRDVFMSLWNHHSGYTDAMLEMFRSTPDVACADFPRPPSDPREFFRDWVSRGSFEWEHDGYPYWSHHHHLASYWAERQRENVLLVHFNDLLTDLAGQMRRVASFVGVPIDERTFPAQVQAATFESMKENADKIVPFASRVWKGGGDQFINKGTNGRWREVLSEEDLALYAAARDRELTQDAANWLTHGGAY
jgi:aryl sulfotransferase